MLSGSKGFLRVCQVYSVDWPSDREVKLHLLLTSRPGEGKSNPSKGVLLGKSKLCLSLLAVLALTSCQTAQRSKSLSQPSSRLLAPRPLPLQPPAPAFEDLSSRTQFSPTKATVGQLINQAEDDYTAGLDDYQSGEMGRAKQEFDDALAVLLQSRVGVLNDDRLTEEFELLEDNINDVELAAIKQGNPLSAHPYVPTPIESFSGLTFTANPGVTRRMRQEMLSVHSDIPLVMNQSVSGAVAYLTQHARGYLESVLERLGKYGPMISKSLREDGLPQDLVYLPGPESAYDPQALSRKGARGLWQLMPATAELYGLKVNYSVDEREDPFKSTQAAARDLKYLYKTFGDWDLALAAYDSGPVTVQRAIQRTGYADYWTLRRLHVLPPETESYVPVFLATALIAKDPAAYGLNVRPDPQLEVERVSVRVPTDLRLIADLIDYPADELASLNPDLKTWTTPADDPGFTLNLPRGSGKIFEREIASVPAADRRWWRAHRVAPGETLGEIASRYDVPREKLAEANHLGVSDDLRDGSHLLIPLYPSVRSLMARASGRFVRRAYYYRIKRGDNLELLADRYDVTAYQIRRWNHLRSSHLIAGRRLLVYRLVPVYHEGGRSVHRRRTRRARVTAKYGRNRRILAERDPPTGKVAVSPAANSSSRPALSH
jgi:peptidoglycan lytic transglycosylase D